MNPIQELARISDYKPTKGAKLLLYDIANIEGMNKDELIDRFEKTRYAKQSRTVYKRLKDDLLNGLSEAKLKQLPKDQKIKFSIWKKHLQTKMLLSANRKGVGVKMAIETVKMANFYGELEVVISLCKELVHHYSNIVPNSTLYKKYNSRLKIANKSYFVQNEVELLYRELIICHQKNWSFKHLEGEIEALITVPPKSNHYKYRYQYHSLKGLYYQLKLSSDFVVKNATEAIDFFDNCEESITYFPKYSFLSEPIPVYINRGNFIQAESNINTCLELEPIGTNNWHNTLSERAILGFHSKKIRMIEHALKLHLVNQMKLINPKIIERWKIIVGYLYFYKRVSNLDATFESNLISPKSKNEQKKKIAQSTSTLKIQGYLNGFDISKDNVSLKISTLILELLLRLSENDKNGFSRALEGLDQFISRNLRKHIYTRPKHFLRLLRCVEKGDYNKIRVAAHAKRYLASLKSIKPIETALRYDFELVPYEHIWELVMVNLDKPSRV